MFISPDDVDIPDGSFIQIHTPIKNQAFHGTCWAFATVAAFESALMVQKDGLDGEDAYEPWELQDNSYDLSEQFASFHDIDWDIYIESIYDPVQSDVIIQDSNADVGGNQIFSTYNSVRYGLPLESDFPYSKFDFNPWITWNPTNNKWEENIVKSTKTVQIYYADELSWEGVPYEIYMNAVKEALVKFGALGVSFRVPADFDYYTGGVYVPTTKTVTGGHAVTLVGWLDMAGLKAAFPDLISPEATSITVNDPFSGLYMGSDRVLDNQEQLGRLGLERLLRGTGRFKAALRVLCQQRLRYQLLDDRVQRNVCSDIRRGL